MFSGVILVHFILDKFEVNGSLEKHKVLSRVKLEMHLDKYFVDASSREFKKKMK